MSQGRVQDGRYDGFAWTRPGESGYLCRPQEVLETIHGRHKNDLI